MIILLLLPLILIYLFFFNQLRTQLRTVTRKLNGNLIGKEMIDLKFDMVVFGLADLLFRILLLENVSDVYLEVANDAGINILLFSH